MNSFLKKFIESVTEFCYKGRAMSKTIFQDCLFHLIPFEVVALMMNDRC